jgi:CspA family cold shock protein
MAIGTVKFFNAAKGFGFIVPEDGGRDVFFHKTSVEVAGIDRLTQGQRLSFVTVQDAKGAMQASELKPHIAETVSNSAASNPFEPTSEKNSISESVRKIASGRASSRKESAVVLADPTGSRRDSVTQNMSEWRRSYDRYCNLATNAGEDGVARQNYWQHAEHFLRMLNGSAN